jgi:hypothetical protein
MHAIVFPFHFLSSFPLSLFHVAVCISIIYTPYVPIHRRYSFLEKIQNIRLLTIFVWSSWLPHDFFLTCKQIWSGERGDRKFPHISSLSHLKPTKINCLTCALIFVRKTIPLIYTRNGGSAICKIILTIFIYLKQASYAVSLTWPCIQYFFFKKRACNFNILQAPHTTFFLARDMQL